MTGYADPEGEAPWAMQLVVRLEKTGIPSHTAVCEAAAMATVALLAQAEGEWAEAVQRWQSGRIRKLVRRARGASWEKSQSYPGVTVQHRGAEVRALVPGPTDAVPPDISRLQVQGLDLEDEEAQAKPFEGVVVSITPEPKLTTGKAAAAAGHAAQLAWMKMSDEPLERWTRAGFPVRVEHPTPARFRELVKTEPIVVVDAGFTETCPDTVTAVAHWG
jgi:peptidyl-tRNA hydrolase